MIEVGEPVVVQVLVSSKNTGRLSVLLSGIFAIIETEHHLPGTRNRHEIQTGICPTNGNAKGRWAQVGRSDVHSSLVQT
ncbi:hypothetical protein Pan241w_41610 [Gimesia alba]|uniref:Uncharacterized protein n=1 Tax=Gimesia alba TaxID=2527973 RepID=A0A517RJL9_9PLAN|nr:hypothetical protein Pan241w_41610 [Gimesia alba]